MDKYIETVFSYNTKHLTVKVLKENGEYTVMSTGEGWRSTAKFNEGELDAAMDEAMRILNDEDADE
jgi:hypothetical protein